MPELQPVSSAHLSAVERPSCPTCRHDRMLLCKVEAGPSGLDYRTFKCPKCGRVHTAVESGDPMTSGMLGWLAGELRPPT
jgi:Zn finger protein HypA/HybF involved in hydrogenase expression